MPTKGSLDSWTDLAWLVFRCFLRMELAGDRDRAEQPGAASSVSGLCRGACVGICFHRSGPVAQSRCLGFVLVSWRIRDQLELLRHELGLLAFGVAESWSQQSRSQLLSPRLVRW